MDFNTYDIDPSIYDEMFRNDGTPRDHSRTLFDVLSRFSPEELKSLQERVVHSFRNEGITFTVYGDAEAEERIIPVDCLPRIMSNAEWRQVERGLAQRIRALNLFLDDIYRPSPVGNPGRKPEIVREGIIPEHAIFSCPQYRPELQGFSPPHGVWVAICGTDLVRTNDGFRVLEDNLRVPSGVSYMLANRKASKSVLRRLYRASKVMEVEHYGRVLLTTLEELAPAGVAEPTIALLTPGVHNSAFYEHMFLARELGAELVEGQDLLVRNRRVFMRTTQGLRQVHVIYRRVDDDFIDPAVFRPDSLLGAPGLIDAYKEGNVTLVNAPGTGVADDKSIYFYVPEMVRFYLAEEPILANVETYLCRNPADLEYTLDNLERLVVKQVGGAGGYGMLIGPHATAPEREDYAKEIRADPANFIAQPTLALSRAPCLVDGRFEARHVDLRPFILHGREARVVPGALCRVALRRGSLVVNSSQGGGSKDFWVLED